MFKRILSMILCITLICLIAMPVTAEETKETNESKQTTRSMEEILNDFHARSAALTTASTNSRSASTDQKTQLKQETIAELNAAGYSAYDVNPTTFSNLEETLQTDFSAMGLDSNGSYIIVISGEEGEDGEETPANGSRGLILPPHQWEDDTPGGNYFYYTYDGTRYQMRYLTVSPDTNTSLGQTSEVELLAEDNPSAFGDFLNASISAVATISAEVLQLGTIFGILSFVESNFFDDDYVTPLTASLEYRGSTSWHITYTQIYDSSDSKWKIGSSVEYVNMRYFVDYNYYDSTTKQYEEIETEGLYDVRYSEYYEDDEWKKEYAVLGFNDGFLWLDVIPSVTYKFAHPDRPNEIIRTITHERWQEPIYYQPQ